MLQSRSAKYARRQGKGEGPRLASEATAMSIAMAIVATIALVVDAIGINFVALVIARPRWQTKKYQDHCGGCC